jgi:hypothetical protein
MSLRPTLDKSKIAQQAAVEKHKAAYFAKGGRIEVLPPMEFTYRLHTVSTGSGQGADLMLYASKRDAITGKREERRIRASNANAFLHTLGE